MNISVVPRTVVILRHVLNEADRIVHELGRAGNIGKKSVETHLITSKARDPYAQTKETFIDLEFTPEEMNQGRALVNQILQEYNFNVTHDGDVTTVSLKF